MKLGANEWSVQDFVKEVSARADFGEPDAEILALAAGGARLSAARLLFPGSPELDDEVSLRFLEYLIPYIAWVRQANGVPAKQGIAQFSGPLHSLRELPLTTTLGMSAVDLLEQYFGSPSSGERSWRNYYGAYHTDADIETLRRAVQATAVFLGSEWSDSAITAGFTHINELFEVPPFFYAEENFALRWFWNLAFVSDVWLEFRLRIDSPIPPIHAAYVQLVSTVDTLRTLTLNAGARSAGRNP